MWRYKKVIKRIEQLECEVRTGHSACFVEQEYNFLGNNKRFKFICRLCKCVIYKQDFELTEAERDYLIGLGINLSSIWPMPKAKIKEGYVRKGGRKNPPKTPKPKIKISGQKSRDVRP